MGSMDRRYPQRHGLQHHLLVSLFLCLVCTLVGLDEGNVQAAIFILQLRRFLSDGLNLKMMEGEPR